jgi:hypothetical protein
VKVSQLPVNSPQHVMACAARVMQSVGVDLKRETQAACRGGGQQHVTLSTEVLATGTEPAALCTPRCVDS